MKECCIYEKGQKIVALITAMVLCVVLFTACGESKSEVKETCKYTAVSGTVNGVTLSGENVAKFGLELKEGGKGTVSLAGDSAEFDRTSDDTTITLTVEGVNMAGKLDGNKIILEHFLEEMIGVSMDLTFEKQ